MRYECHPWQLDAGSPCRDDGLDVLTTDKSCQAKFEARWNWEYLFARNKDLPTLRPADIVAIMEHHSGGKLISE
jgi:hypothetical protein